MTTCITLDVGMAGVSAARVQVPGTPVMGTPTSGILADSGSLPALLRGKVPVVTSTEVVIDLPRSARYALGEQRGSIELGDSAWRIQNMY